MVEYNVSFQDFGGRVFSTANLNAANDQQAIAIARRIYSSGIGDGYEIYCQGRHVHTERLSAPTIGLTRSSTESSAA